MLYVDDRLYDQKYFEECFSNFDAHPILGRCATYRIAVRLTDPALWIALCLYVKERRGTVLPLSADSPYEAARRRAVRAGCQFLFFGASEDALHAPKDLRPVDDRRAASASPSLIQTSSGTTGHPKIVDRAWSDIDVEVEHYVQDFSGAEGTTPIIVAPVTHSYGLISGVLAALKRGDVPRIIQNRNPKYILRNLSEMSTPLVYTSPSLLMTLSLLVPEDRPIFSVITSGTTMPKSSFDLAATKIQHLHQQYGCSEVGCITLGQNIIAANDLGVAVTHLKLSAGASVSTPGEIIATPKGRPAISTGDLGYLKENRLHFLARVDDMINVAGFNVYPAEVEEVVLEMPDVSEAVVFGKPYRLGHEQVVLQFVAKSEVPDHAMRAWCAARLTSYQVPMSIEQVSAIPKLENGKVSRKALAQA